MDGADIVYYETEVILHQTRLSSVNFHVPGRSGNTGVPDTTRVPIAWRNACSGRPPRTQQCVYIAALPCLLSTSSALSLRRCDTLRTALPPTG